MFNRSASVGSNLGVSSPGREKSPAKEHIPNLGLLFNYPQFPSKWRDKTLFTAHGVFQMVQISKNYQRKIVNIFLSIHFNICFGCSKELSQWDGSFEYSQHLFWLRNKKINFCLYTLIWRPGWSWISSQPLLILFSLLNLGISSVGRERVRQKRIYSKSRSYCSTTRNFKTLTHLDQTEFPTHILNQSITFWSVVGWYFSFLSKF